MNNYTSFISLLDGFIPSKEHQPFLYEVGQKVRISKRVVESKKLPYYWSGALVQILSRRHADTKAHKHVYKVRILHSDKIGEFYEEEFDRRYIRKNLDKKAA